MEQLSIVKNFLLYYPYGSSCIPVTAIRSFTQFLNSVLEHIESNVTLCAGTNADLAVLGEW